MLKSYQQMKSFFIMIQKEHPRLPIYIFVGSLLKAMIPFISLFYTSHILDALLLRKQEEAIYYIVSLLGITLILGLIQVMCFRAVEAGSRVCKFTTQKQITEKAFMLAYEKFEKKETMDQIKMAKDSANGAGGVCEQLLSMYAFFTMVFSLFFSLLFTVYLLLSVSLDSSHLLTSWVSIVLLVIAFLVMTYICIYIEKKNAQEMQKMEMDNVELNGITNYLYIAMTRLIEGKDIRMYKMQELFRSWTDRFMELSKKAFHPYASYLGKISFKVSYISTLFTGFVFIFVGVRVLNGSISIGDVFLYTGAITRFASDFSEALRHYNRICYRFTYLDSFQQFINSQNMDYDGTLPIEKRDDAQYEFTFKNVSFHYPGNNKDVLKNLNLKFTIGKKFALVGENGSGKTTLIKLLCRLYEPSEGEILLNGIDIRKYDYAQYTSIFSIVFQDYKLFSLPLANNVSCDIEVDEKRCKKVLEQVGIKEKVEHFEKGIFTPLFKDLEEGRNVSGGEGQKIAIARALYKDAPFVIMDEPTAALDPLAEAEIYEDFNEMVEGKTAIFVSHRMSSCKFCDDILVLSNGNIVERGNHDTLLSLHGLYASMWEAQAQYYK